MAQPTQLTPTEQDALVKQIGLAMLRVAPDGWEQLTVDYRAVGRYSEATGKVVYTDGGSEPWTMPADLQGLFARLRGGMYREGRGTWFNARYRLDHPSSYNLEYDREEPAWEMPPPPQAYPDDVRLFPRSEDNVPSWLRRRLSSAPPPRFRVARIFDGPGPDGRPSVSRPPVSPADVHAVLGYLDSAPLTGPGRGYDVDRLDPDGRPSVPVAFHTDGTWIWPAAVNYYLRDHDIPPEPELVDHIARQGFQVPSIDEAVRAAAAAFLGVPGPGGPGPGPGSPGPGGPGPGPGPGGPPRPPAPTRAMPVPAAATQLVRPPDTSGMPPAALPSQGPPGVTVDALRSRLAELSVPESAFRIGPPAGQAWTMEQTDEGWRVGWFDNGFVAPAMFEDVADASAFLLGKLLLDAGRWQGAPDRPAQLPMPTVVAGPARPGPDFGGTDAPAGSGFRPVFAGPDRANGRAGPDADLPRRSGGGGAPEAEPAVSGRRSRRSDAEPAMFNRHEESPGFSRGRRGLPDADNGRSDFGAPDADPAATAFGRPDFGEPGRAGHSRPDPADASADLGGSGPGLFGRTDTGAEFGHADAEPAGFGRHDSVNGREDAEVSPFGRAASDRPEFARPDLSGSGRADFAEPGRTDFAEPGRADFAEPGRADFAEPVRADFEPADSGRHGRAPDPVRAEPLGAEPPRPGFDPVPTRAEPPRAEPMRRPEPAGAPPANQDWPISPLPGEPPLTLFRGKRLVELEPGTEIDRFGEDDGNLVYAVGTPFSERSLVPEWVERPYHAYRVRQPVQVLTGAAIPWFDQPGGGTAFLLPDAVGELVALGRLVEINGRDRPRG